MIKLYVADASPLMDKKLYEACYEISTKERKEKADRRRCHPDKANCILAGLLLQYAYTQFSKGLADANSFGVCTERVEEVSLESLMDDSLKSLSMPAEKEGENGKPCFCQDNAPFFNLSHSGTKVSCIMADREVGLDIQKLSKVREAVVRKCFLPREFVLLETAEDKNRVFTRIWSRKEAEAKLSGKGLSEILSAKQDGEEVYVVSKWIDEEYVISYACHKVVKENR